VRLVARHNPGQVAAAEAFVQKGAWVSVLALVDAQAIGMLLDHLDLVLRDAPSAGHLRPESFKSGWSTKA
jgi:hypothetical protein